MEIPQELDTRAFRREFGLNQDTFARRLNVSFYSVAGWESRQSASPAAVELLRLRLPTLRAELEQEQAAKTTGAV